MQSLNMSAARLMIQTRAVLRRKSTYDFQELFCPEDAIYANSCDLHYIT